MHFITLLKMQFIFSLTALILAHERSLTGH